MKRFFSRIVDVKPDEPRALWLGFVFHFLILTGYYILRPIRDSIAASNRLETLPWMFTATLVGMLIANAVFAAIVARMSRRKFIPIAYAFFIFNLALFFILMRSFPPAQQVWIGRALYVWVSVFNLFNTAIFWAFMTDLFTVEQGKRLYGFIAVGGSLGAIFGAYITKHYVRDIGPANLLVISAMMFAVAGSLVRFFPSGFAEEDKPAPAREEPIGGSIWAGITHIARSPYLFGLAASMLLYTTTSTWAYFQQTDLAREALKSSNDRTVFLANLEIWVNSITVIIQIFLTGRLLKWFGVGFTLVSLPFLSMIGFGAMGIAPSLALLAVFQVARRAAAYALMRPSREILFTVLRREDKYKVKSVTDTLIYRIGDQLGAWSYGGLHALGLELQGISFIAVPVTAGWCGLSLWLARKQRALAQAQRADRTALLDDMAASELA
ncbi:MAG: MFS transporter [Verrucomicrobia bacterium]|jgi:ATP:ADP antiporter, AAA family|nr:MAG: MFS transporter [Verrucomicrobiota bacterium]